MRKTSPPFRRFARANCLAAWAAVLGMAGAAHAQQRPDAGTLQEQPRLLPMLPAPGGPAVTLPAPAAAPAAASTAPIYPIGFRFEGNAAVATEALQALLAPRVGVQTNLAGLQQAAQEVKQYYQDRGLLLTEAYIPHQSLDPAGAVVTIAIVEARIGRVDVQADGPAPARRLAEAVVAATMQRGDAASEYRLDQPVLLLRDRAGYDATATVQPGASSGEIDVAIRVRALPPAATFFVGADNHGVRAAGTARAFAGVEVTNPTGIGDLLTARVQLAENTGTRLYRVAYAAPVTAGGTRLVLDAVRSEYVLGAPYEALGAHGQADVLSAGLLHPLLRGRAHNLYAVATVEHKTLRDEVALLPESRRRIGLVRLGLVGNVAEDESPLGAGAYTSWGVSIVRGRQRMDDLTLAIDQGLGGPRTAGDFTKVNLEAQRAQFLDARWTLQGSLQAQWASRNLASAEKMWLGGPDGVRGYPAGDAGGDSAAIAVLELRYLFGPQAWSALQPLQAGPFLDWGRVRISQEPLPGADNHRTLRSAGLALHAGHSGDLLLNAAIAWRLGSTLPGAGAADRRPRAWLSVQKWF
jgi:hemolysin activation/secretion protein